MSKSKQAALPGCEAPHRHTLYVIAQVLAEVCQMDFGLNRGRLLKESQRLAPAGPTPALLRERYGPGGWWYDEDWRGRRGQPPSPSDVRATWGRWEHVRRGALDVIREVLEDDRGDR